MRVKPILFMILALMAASLACTQFTVINESERPASVQVHLPDGSNNIVLLGPGGYRTWLVIEGGPYQVSVVPYESFVNYMKEIQASTVGALLTGEVDQAYTRFIASEADPITAFRAYSDLQTAIESELKGVTCNGELPYTDIEAVEFELGFSETDQETVSLSTSASDASWICEN